MAKVLVTEQVDQRGLDLLRKAGHEVIEADRDWEVIRREMPEADAVLVRIAELPGELLGTAKHLKVVSKHGVGYDNIDLKYCKEAGVAVTTTPGANSVSVAEHAFALMMTLAKRIISVSRAYKEIGFDAKNTAPGVELTGKVLGLIGSGRIGSIFAKMCHFGLDMKVVAYDPYAKAAPEWMELAGTADEVLKQADVLSLHCALTDETRKMINRERIGMMKPEAILINCARGPIVDEEAVIEAIENGKLGAAGLDVTDPEPVEPGSKLFQMDKIIVTPHFAPTTKESALRVAQISCENILAVLEDREPVGRVV